MSAKKKLTDREIKVLGKLLKKVRPIPNIPRELFLPIMSKNVPATTELAIIRKGSLLLTYRDDDFYKGWHFPGSFMSPGDTFEKSCRRVAFDETGLRPKKCSLLSAAVYSRDKRFPCASLFFKCSVVGVSKHGRWFRAMPKDIIPSHKPLWKIALGAIRAGKKQ